MKIKELHHHFLSSSGISTDTRTIELGNLFFALKGPNFDANAFAEKALENGAKLAIIDDPKHLVDGDNRYVLVEDGLKTLQALATYHRDQFQIPVIGLTGSNGKTTSKELINVVLSTQYKTLATKGNLNNHIGVPLTLLCMETETEIAIIEMGANKQGDIAELSGIAKPTHGFITNIGKAHLEGMGGFEGVLKTKTELFQFLKETGGNVFINTLQSIFSNMLKRFEDPILFPEPGSFCEVKFEGADPFVSFSLPGINLQFTSQLIGAYNFDNIAAAIAIGKYFGIAPETAAKAIIGYIPSNMRSQVLEKRSNLILLDAYNANPSSMAAALQTFGTMKQRKKSMVVLGDMLELGDQAEKEHAQIGEILAHLQIDKVCLTGNLIQAALKNIPNALYFPDPFSLRNWLQDSKLEDYQILIKGSRGMKLEGLVDFI